MTASYVLVLDGDERMVLRLLRLLLKRLGRDCGVRCRSIRPMDDNETCT